MSEASEEATAAGYRVNEALQEPCVHGLTHPNGGTTSKWDCWGCTGDVVAAEVDRVSRERTRQALERAAAEAEDCFAGTNIAARIRALIPGEK